ncbi:MAG: hypothetical protein HC896_18355 [Bacteroidales bacterium]|nr:hypothetical protein [Bacteroidales bacterium]
MLKTSVAAYVHKLNCQGGIVYKKERKGAEGFAYVSFFSLPYTLEVAGKHGYINLHVPSLLSHDKFDPFVKSLPKIVSLDTNQFLHLMDLPGFGLLALLKKTRPCPMPCYAACLSLTLNWPRRP